MINQVVAAVDRRHHVNLAVHRFVAVTGDRVAFWKLKSQSNGYPSLISPRMDSLRENLIHA